MTLHATLFLPYGIALYHLDHLLGQSAMHQIMTATEYKAHT